jgi:hypothetical protein
MHKSWENQPQQQRRLCWQILLTILRRLKARDPFALQLKQQQTGEAAGESQAPWNWAHSAKGAQCYRKACRSRGIEMAAPPLDSPCDRPVISRWQHNTRKILKRRSGSTLNIVCDIIFYIFLIKILRIIRIPSLETMRNWMNFFGSIETSYVLIFRVKDQRKCAWVKTLYTILLWGVSVCGCCVSLVHSGQRLSVLFGM